MTTLHVADAHLNLRWYHCLAVQAPRYDLLVIFGAFGIRGHDAR